MSSCSRDVVQAFIDDTNLFRSPSGVAPPPDVQLWRPVIVSAVPLRYASDTMQVWLKGVDILEGVWFVSKLNEKVYWAHPDLHTDDDPATTIVNYLNSKGAKQGELYAMPFTETPTMWPKPPWDDNTPPISYQNRDVVDCGSGGGGIPWTPLGPSTPGEHSLVLVILVALLVAAVVGLVLYKNYY